jgi:tRNA (cytidine/uridine-2'-O-)-methyltransferase
VMVSPLPDFKTVRRTPDLKTTGGPDGNAVHSALYCLIVSSSVTATLFHIILFQPEIPPNTGNVIRLAANTGAQLHLIEPLGFDLDEKKVRRAGLDYHQMSVVKRWPDWQTFVQSATVRRIYAFSTKAVSVYSEAVFEEGDGLLFGPETRGLPAAILEDLPTAQRLRIPMQADSRSLNLSNTVAIALYEAMRQHNFAGLR